MIVNRKEEFLKRLGEVFKENDIICLMEAARLSLSQNEILSELDLSENHVSDLQAQVSEFMDSI